MKTPLTIPSFEVLAEQRDGKLVLADVKGSNFQLAATSLEYTSADGFKASGAATLHAAKFSRDAVDGLVLDIPIGEAVVQGANQGRAELSGLHLEASGRKEDLSGNARLHLNDVGLSLALELSALRARTFRCAGACEA
ncbi:MAG TPA: hypothetical protein VH988_28645 [Thermoanaerobaculia bacterium]|nr:hypothetical protein [Thermoanaerobaculia bacterium]